MRGAITQDDPQVLKLSRTLAYKPFKLELISFIGVLGGYDFVATNSLDVARQIAGGPKSDFEKPLSLGKSLLSVMTSQLHDRMLTQVD